MNFQADFALKEKKKKAFVLLIVKAFLLKLII